jgi:hypothetical protein
MPTSSLAAIGRLLGSDRLKGMAAIFGLQAPISAKEVRAQAAARFFVSGWQLVTSLGIERPYSGAGSENQAAWHAGHLTDTLPFDSERVLVASATGGVWLATPDESSPTDSLSLGWPSVDMRCLGSGPRGPRHFYAAGDNGALFETETQSLRSVSSFFATKSTKTIATILNLDPQNPVKVSEILRSTDAPLHDWKQIHVLDRFGETLYVGAINRLASVTDSQPAKLVLATDSGVYWSDTPGAGQAYQFVQATGMPNSRCWGVAVSPGNPGATIVASPTGNRDTPDANGLYVGNWLDSDLAMERAVHVGDFEFSKWNDAVLAGCAGDRRIMYASVSDSGAPPRSLKRAFLAQGATVPPLSVKQLAALVSSYSSKPPAPPISVKDFLGQEAVYVVVKSEDGGRIWSPVGPNRRVDESVRFPTRPGQAPPPGNYQYATLCVAASPVDRDTIALGTRTGPLIGRDLSAAFTWEDHGDESTPGAAGSPHLHGDLHSVQFDPSDTDGRTLYVCSDGGLAYTTDLGQTFTSNINKSLPNLQFQSYPARAYASPVNMAGTGAAGASFDTPGLVAGPLQDNGVVFSFRLAGEQTPWQSLNGVDDGLMGIFLEGDLLLFWNNDNGTARVAKWHGAQFDPAVNVQVRTASGDVAANSTLNEPFCEPVMTPTFRRAQTNQLLLAVGAYNPTSSYRDIWGLFADDGGGNPSWDYLATIPISTDPTVGDQVTAIGSRDGSNVLVGTQAGRIFSVDPRSTTVHEFAIASDLPVLDGQVFQFAFGSTWTVARHQNNLVHLDAGSNLWTSVTTNGLPTDEGLYFMAVDAIRTPNILYIATDMGVHASWDEGANWLPVSQGLPAQAHPSTLRFIRQPNGGRNLYLSTFGWSAFQTNLA